jgi:hypothetical protein
MAGGERGKKLNGLNGLEFRGEEHQKNKTFYVLCSSYEKK